MIQEIETGAYIFGYLSSAFVSWQVEKYPIPLIRSIVLDMRTNENLIIKMWVIKEPAPERHNVLIHVKIMRIKVAKAYFLPNIRLTFSVLFKIG